MTPKEKAKELTNKYLRIGMIIRPAKECALVCVDEILGDKISLSYFEWKYWKKVKKKIKKL